MVAQTHLVRRGNTFHFRIAVPRELVARVGKAEIKTTLRTTDPLTARQRSRVLSSAIEALFEEVRRMPELTRQHVERRVREYFQDCLDRSHELADLLPQDKRSWDRDAEVATLHRRIENLTRALADRDFTPALEREVLDILHPDEPEAQKGDLDTFRYACALVLRAKIQDAKLLAAEFMGEPSRPSDPMFEDARTPEFPPLPGEERRRSRVVIHRVGHEEDAISYEEMIRRYRAQRQVENLAPRTLLELDRAFRLGSEVIEPTLPISQITAEHVRAVRDLISRLPANFDKNEAFAGMTAQRAVEANEKSGASCISPATQVKLFRFFKMPIQWAAKEGYIPTVPGASITITAPKTQGDPEKGRKPYTEADLKLMFTSPLFTGCASEPRRTRPGPYLFKDGWYWVPIIGFYSGMRLAEVVQLGTDDVQQQADIWFMDVRPGPIPNTGEMKRVKNKAAIRKVPVADDLLKLGFLDVVRRAEKGGRLFPEIKFGHDGTPSKNFSKFWSRYGKAIGFRTDDHVFHSLRHTMADMTRDAKMNMEASTAMMGHTLPGARSLYGKGMSLQPLKEEMDRIKPPIDLVALLEEAQRGKVELMETGWQSRSKRRPRSLTSPQPPSNLPVKRRGRPRRTASNPAEGPAPFIDKISVVMDVPADMAHASFQSVMVQTKDAEVFKASQTKPPFNRTWRIAINCITNAKKWPVLMASFDKASQQALKFRVEFSPVDLGTKGLEELHAALMMLVDGGWKSFAEHGRVTIIEVTVDLPGVGVDQFDALPKQAVYRQAWGKDGHLETIVFGKASGNQTKIYNRGKKRTDKGQKWLGPVTTRVERRLRPQGLKLAELPKIANPFADIILPTSSIPAPPDEPETKTYLWALFQDSIKVRGLTGALNLLPEAKRTTYRAWLKQHPVPWWSPQAIWMQWPDYIADLRISDPKAWT